MDSLAPKYRGSKIPGDTRTRNTLKFEAILHFTGTEGNYIDIYINN